MEARSEPGATTARSGAKPSPLVPLLRKFVPLSLSDVMMALGDPLQTAALGRLPNAHLNLASVGIVKAIAVFLESPVIMLLHASTTLSGRAASRRALWRFMLLLGASLTGFFVLLAWRPVYSWLFAHAFRVTSAVAVAARPMFLLMVLWPAVIAWRRFYQGLLIRHGKSRQVGWASLFRMGWVVSALSLGVFLKVDGALLAGVTMIGAVVTEAITVTIFARGLRLVQPSEPGVRPSDQSLPSTFPSVVRFYTPLAATMLVVWGGRAVLLSVVARAPDGLVALAAWPAAWGLILSVANATRMVQQVVISSPGEVTKGQLLQFVVVVGLVCSVVLALLGFVPSGMDLLAYLLGGDSMLTRAAAQAVEVSAVFPLLLAIQNAFQGFLIRDGRTVWVQAATFAGVAMMLATSWILVVAGTRGAFAAACAMVMGVFLEITVLALGLKCGSGRLPQ